MNDEQLRQAWQQPGGAELDAAELEALLDGRLAPERRAALLARVASDADAALQLQLAMDLRAAAAGAPSKRSAVARISSDWASGRRRSRAR